MESSQPLRHFRYFHLKEPSAGALDHFAELFGKERLHFSNPAYFNDPFDCLPCLKEFTPIVVDKTFETKWEDHIKQLIINAKSKGHELDPRNIAAEKKKVYAKTKKVLTKEIVHDLFACNFLQGLGRDFGVLCLCGNVTTSLMWSHYADNHKGMAVELNLSRLNLKDCEVLPVDYDSSHRPMLPIDGLMRAEMTKFKSKEWRYEEETRIICSLTNLENDNNRHFLKIPVEAISHVYLGWRFWASQVDVKNSPRYKYILKTLESRGFLDRKQVSIMSPSELDYTLTPTLVQSFDDFGRVVS